MLDKMCSKSVSENPFLGSGRFTVLASLSHLGIQTRYIQKTATLIEKMLP